MLSVGEWVADRYRVERVLGEGGMGIVYAVTDANNNAYALKVLLDDTDAVMRKRFVREGQNARRLSGPHVTQIHGAGELANGSPFLLMELLHGEDLGALLERHGSLPCDEAVGYILDACIALEQAHLLGMIHRDVKPANLFLATLADGTRCVKLLDFGISKSALSNEVPMTKLTQQGEAIGSPEYMSPEQLVSSADVDGRADIWSLGATLFELLTCRSAFAGTTLMEVVTAVMRDPPAPLRSLRPDASPELEAILRCCLEKDPELRHRSIGELANWLRPLAGGAQYNRPTEGSTGATPSASVPSGAASSGRVVIESGRVDGEPTADGQSNTMVAESPIARTAPPMHAPATPSATIPSATIPSATIPSAAIANATVPSAARPSATIASAAIPSAAMPGTSPMGARTTPDLARPMRSRLPTRWIAVAAMFGLLLGGLATFALLQGDGGAPDENREPKMRSKKTENKRNVEPMLSGDAMLSAKARKKARRHIDAATQLLKSEAFDDALSETDAALAITNAIPHSDQSIVKSDANLLRATIARHEAHEQLKRLRSDSDSRVFEAFVAALTLNITKSAQAHGAHPGSSRCIMLHAGTTVRDVAKAVLARDLPPELSARIGKVLSGLLRSSRSFVRERALKYYPHCQVRGRALRAELDEQEKRLSSKR